MKNTKKRERGRKALRRLCVARQENGNTLCALPRCIYEEREPRRDKAKRYGEV